MSREKKIIVGLAFLAAFSLSAYAVDMPQYTRTDYPTDGGAAFMQVGTENGDPYTDLIVISPESNINVLPGGAEGVFGTPVVTITGVPSLKMTVTDDFNNDGLTDIILNDRLFIAKGNCEFYEPKSLEIEDLQTIASADMNGDGNKDLIAIAIINTTPSMRAAELRTYFGNGDGTFREPVKTSIVITRDTTNEVIDDWGSYYIYYSGDFTGDGVPDLVVRRRFSLEAGYTLSYNWTYIGKSEGTFLKNSYNPDGNMFAMEVKDVNGDDIKDIIDIGHFSYILTGDNTGVFSHSAGINFNNDSNYLCFSVADVNGDGILDYTFARILEFQGDMSLSTALGTGDGYSGGEYTFTVRLPNSVWFYSGWAYETNKPLTYDFNNDGCADFIIPHKATGEIAVILSKKSTGVHEERPLNVPIVDQNVPNPFNASTTIPYSLYRPGIYKLAVYDILGRKIVTLFDEYQSSGEHRVSWNGKDEHGADAASGIYLYMLNARGEKGIVAKKRLLLMK